MIEHPDSPLDLRSLDPRADPAREERIVGAVMREIAAAAPEDASLLVAVLSFARPALIAASAVLVLGGALLLEAPHDQPFLGPTTLAGAVGVPPMVERWAEGGTLDALDSLELINELGADR